MRTESARPPARAQRRLAFLTAVWLTVQGFNTTPFVAGSLEWTLLASFLWILPAILFVEGRSVLRFGVRPFLADRLTMPLFGLFVLSACVSATLSRDPGRSFGYVLLTALAVLVWVEIHGFLGPEFARAMRWYAVLGALSLLPIYLRGPLPGFWGRLAIGPTDHPNHLATVCLAVLCGALAWRNWLVRAPIALLMMAMMLATESRGRILATIATGGVLAFFELRRLNRHARILTAAGGLALAIVCAALFYDQAAGYVASALALDNKYRGVQSGFGGRFDLWDVGVDLFVGNPVFGVGYRVHGQYLPERFVALGAVHNGYLALIIETGLVGAILLLSLIALRLRERARQAFAGDRMQQLGLSVAVGYFALALIEPMLLNIANPHSALAWCFVFGSLPARRLQPLAWRRPAAGAREWSGARPVWAGQGRS